MSARSLRPAASEEISCVPCDGAMPVVRAKSSSAADPEALRPAPLSFPFVLSWHATSVRDATAERSTMREAPAQHPAKLVRMLQKTTELVAAQHLSAEAGAAISDALVHGAPDAVREVETKLELLHQEHQHLTEAQAQTCARERSHLLMAIGEEVHAHSRRARARGREAKAEAEAEAEAEADADAEAKAAGAETRAGASAGTEAGVEYQELIGEPTAAATMAAYNAAATAISIKHVVGAPSPPSPSPSTGRKKSSSPARAQWRKQWMRKVAQASSFVSRNAHTKSPSVALQESNPYSRQNYYSRIHNGGSGGGHTDTASTAPMAGMFSSAPTTPGGRLRAISDASQKQCAQNVNTIKMSPADRVEDAWFGALDAVLEQDEEQSFDQEGMNDESNGNKLEQRRASMKSMPSRSQSEQRLLRMLTAEQHAVRKSTLHWRLGRNKFPCVRSPSYQQLTARQPTVAPRRLRIMQPASTHGTTQLATANSAGHGSEIRHVRNRSSDFSLLRKATSGGNRSRASCSLPQPMECKTSSPTTPHESSRSCHETAGAMSAVRHVRKELLTSGVGSQSEWASRTSQSHSISTETRKHSVSAESDAVMLLDLLGEGSFGMVYKARLKTSGKLVVMKQIKCHSAAQSGSVSTMFIKEVRLLKQLNHRNVLRGEGFSVTPDGKWLCILTEYCAGGNLLQLLQTYRCPTQIPPQPAASIPVVDEDECIRHSPVEPRSSRSPTGELLRQTLEDEFAGYESWSHVVSPRVGAGDVSQGFERASTRAAQCKYSPSTPQVAPSLAQPVLGWRHRAAIALDIAAGMAYLHSEAVIHRDLKAENCLLRLIPSLATASVRASGRPSLKVNVSGGGSARGAPVHLHASDRFECVVADMGVARVLPLHMQSQAQHGHVASAQWNEGKRAGHRAARKRMSGVGSWFVQSPELLKGERYDERSDVFSFGLLCATLLSGMPETELPRGDGFGLDTEALILHCAGSLGIGAAAAEPPFGDDIFSALLLQTAHECCALQPDFRPTFAQVQSRLSAALDV